MFGNNLVFWWCCALLLVGSSSKHQPNLVNNEKHETSTVQGKIDENSIKDYVDEKDILDISTISNFNQTDCNEDSNECFVPYLICNYNFCSLFCCHLDDHLIESNPEEIKVFEAFEDMQYSLQSKNQEINLTAYGLYYDPSEKMFVILEVAYISKNVLIANGTVYFPYHAEFVESKSFCLIDENKNLLHLECDITTFNTLFPTEIVSRILIYDAYDPDNPLKPILHHYISICISLRIISILFLLTIFLVYFILPQLRNKHGFILRNWIGATIVAYIFESADKLFIVTTALRYFIDVTIVLVYIFGFLATYFWLTVMSFDMWWTFRDISSLQTNVRNRQQERERQKKERKKLIMYSVYAWGISFILTIVYAIPMISFPFLSLPPIRPEFGIIIYLYEGNNDDLYYLIPSTICAVISICLFNSTALKIRHYEKNITHHLINIDSQVYKENRKWFVLYYLYTRRYVIIYFINEIYTAL